ncbi:MAG TPA: TraB/GumN family protein, partial [Brevundimonas sp.]|nr:TraB/GumN family protein [Brevundimonas sp.]
WPWGDPEIAPLLRRQWAEAVQTALGEAGVTMAVAQLRVLAEPDGVLDRLEAQGYEIEGPEWKPISDGADAP